MTRPDYDGTRYGGQGGVIGAQQYGNQVPPPPGAHAAVEPQQEPVTPPAPVTPPTPAAPPGYNPYLPPGTYRAAAAAPVIAPGAPAPTAHAPMPSQPMAPQSMAQQSMAPQSMAQQSMSQQPMAAQPMSQQPMAPQPALGAPAMAPAVAAGPAGLANEPAGLVNPVSRAAQRAVATTTATALATGTTAARGAASSVAASVPDTPHHGTVYGGRRPVDGTPVFSGALPRLHIGWHSASLSALELIGVSSPGTGLILGADVDQRPVPVRFFRPEPTRVTLVGGVWAAQMVAFRALAFGANAVVLTSDPAAWHGFGEHATGRSDRVAVLHGERPLQTQGTPQQPMLVIHDLGMVGPSTAVDLGPWQTQMTVLRQLDERGVPALQEGQLVMMQRLAFGEATLAATALRLTGESAQLLQQMEDEMVALIGGGADRYVWISPTSVERRQGPARR